jgi:hypothetical protein
METELRSLRSFPERSKRGLTASVPFPVLPVVQPPFVESGKKPDHGGHGEQQMKETQGGHSVPTRKYREITPQMNSIKEHAWALRAYPTGATGHYKPIKLGECR